MNPLTVCGFPAAESCPKTNPCELHELRLRLAAAQEYATGFANDLDHAESNNSELRVRVRGLEAAIRTSPRMVMEGIVVILAEDLDRALGMAREVK